MTRGQSLAVIAIGIIAVAAFIQVVNVKQRLSGVNFAHSNKPVLM